MAGIGTGEHQHRVGPGDRAGAVADDRRQTQRDRVLGRHDQQGGRAVGDLRGVARVDDAVLLERRLEPGELLDGGPPANAFVGHHRLAVGEHRHDLRLERAVVLRLGRQLVRAHRVLVEPGPREAPFLRDQLGRDALVEREIPIAGKDFRAVRHAGRPRGTERHPAHHLDAACHHDVLLAGHHGLHREVQRLLTRPARAVDGGAGDVFGPARRPAPSTARCCSTGRRPARRSPTRRRRRCRDPRPARSISALRTIADRSAACMSDSPPLRLPTGVRTASTITVSRIFATPIWRYGPSTSERGLALLGERRVRLC